MYEERERRRVAASQRMDLWIARTVRAYQIDISKV